MNDTSYEATEPQIAQGSIKGCVLAHANALGMGQVEEHCIGTISHPRS